MVDIARAPIMRLLGSLLILASAGYGCERPVHAQGTRADYERSATLRKAVEQTVFRDQLQPHWLDADHFWYQVATGRERREFVRVDAELGKRSALFDHARLAQALTEKLRRKISADALPLKNLSVESDFKQIAFTVDQRRFRCNLATYELTEDADANDAPSLPVLDEIPRVSRTTGEESEILFVNRSSREVRLFWRNLDGKRVSYSSVAVGQEHRQHTFAGHVWEVSDLEGRFLVGFIATAEPSRAVIDKERRPQSDSEKPTKADNEGRSPDGRWIARVRNHNVVLLTAKKEPGAGSEVVLTRDGNSDDPYGGRVYWSPDSKQFVVIRTRAPERHSIHFVESSPPNQLQPKLHTLEYLKPGDRIAHPRPQLFDVASRRQVPIAEDLFANPWSIDELRWDHDSQRFTFLYNQRGHQTLRVIAVDRSGRASALVDETSRTFIDYHSKRYLRRLDATNEILWMSERDGWNHLWLYDAITGRVKNAVTTGAWVVRSVEHVDEARRQVWFMACGIRPEQDPYYQQLCRTDFDGSGFVVLTQGDGTHEVTFSPDRRWFLDKWSRVDQPPIIELRRAADGRRVCELERADHQALLATGWTTPERFTAKGRDGETEIHGILIRPSTFDPAKRYPVVEQIYAGPHGAFVPKTFGTLAGQHALAELGFIVVQIDGMGTNWRSKRFHDVCWKNLADAGFPDRIAWIKAAAKTRPWMDLDRVGIYGGSAGGQNAMRALIDHHSFYKVAVADCGCHDNRMDKIWWNELWMGYPVGPHYDVSSNAVQAHKLQGHLLLIVGELDRNVDPASTMQVANALQKADKDFDLLVIVGAGHGAAETPYGSRRRSDFLVRHLHGCEPRADR